MANTEYYPNTVNITHRNSKELFQAANTLLCKKKPDALPSHTSKQYLANEKGTCLSEFNEISEEELSAIIQSCSSASCELDPMPTSLVKNLLPTLLPIIH